MRRIEAKRLVCDYRRNMATQHKIMHTLLSLADFSDRKEFHDNVVPILVSKGFEVSGNDETSHGVYESYTLKIGESSTGRHPILTVVWQPDDQYDDLMLIPVERMKAYTGTGVVGPASEIPSLDDVKVIKALSCA